MDQNYTFNGIGFASNADPSVARLQIQRTAGYNGYATQGQIGPATTLGVDPNMGNVLYITTTENQTNVLKALEVFNAPALKFVTMNRVAALWPTLDKNKADIQGSSSTISEILPAQTGGVGAGNQGRGPGFVSGAGSLVMAYPRDGRDGKYGKYGEGRNPQNFLPLGEVHRLLRGGRMRKISLARGIAQGRAMRLAMDILLLKVRER